MNKLKDIRLLVAHQNHDLDAIGACWLFLRFDEEAFRAAQLYFVPAGDEVSERVLEAQGISREEVIHVDTGMGRFDHHQPGNQAYDSATMKVYEYLLEQYPDYGQDEALKRMVDFINGSDHFESCYWPEATHDRYEFMLDEVLKGLRSARHFNDRELVEFGGVCLDGVYAAMRIKVSAEKDLKELGRDFESPWGKALAIENKNDEVIKLAQKAGYSLVVRKDAEQGHMRIKAVPQKEIDLTPVYEKIKAVDTKGSWFFHPAKTMLINHSEKDETKVPTPLTLNQVVGIVEEL
jgi:hypothetical protein